MKNKKKDGEDVFFFSGYLFLLFAVMMIFRNIGAAAKYFF